MSIFSVARERFLLPFFVYGLIWVTLSKGELTSWIVGLPAVALAAITTHRLFAPGSNRINIALLPEFIIWFLWHSLRGGIDVAWRAMQPRVQLEPGFIDYPMKIPPGQARFLLISVVSLLPGTLSADIKGDVLVLHALDTGGNIISETHSAEQRISALYGLQKSAVDE